MAEDVELSRGSAEDLLVSLLMIAELSAAQRELKEAIALYEPPRQAPIFSHDFKATAQAYLALASVLVRDIEDGSSP